MVQQAALIARLLAQSRQHRLAGRPELAAQKCRQVLSMQPDNATAHCELGIILFGQGQTRPALEHVRQAIELDPGQATFHNALGIVYSSTGDLPAGADSFRRALELDPGNAVTCSNLANNYRDQGRSADAVKYYRAALSANPRYTQAAMNLGELHQLQGNLPAAVRVYRKALAGGVASPDIQFRLATTLYHLGKESEAVTLYKAVAAGNPAYPGIHNNLGLALIRLGDYEAGIASYRQAIENEPDSAAAHNNLGNALRNQNDLDGAITHYRRALSLQPNHAQAHSNLLLALNYLPDQSPDTLYRAAVQFETQQAATLGKKRPCWQNSREMNKRLRIGYVSPDFRAHSVAHFTRKLIGTHDREQVEVFCYANVINEDQVTREFRSRADHWVPIVAMPDAAAADRIRSDRIDILIDLAGHTAGNRLLLFARKPAPIQVNWLGYPNTTGMSAMDYRLTDAIADPPGETDRWHSEKLVRLANGFLCYQTSDPQPAVTASPCLERGHITFGSFNSLPKITPEVVRVWSKILHGTADSRLILKSAGFTDEQTRTRYMQKFRARGIGPERLDLLGLVPGRDKHLATYGRIDIGLDTFPYNGTTTTCEALWMGVPVICLLGSRHSGRVGASILHHVGLPDYVADNEDVYINMAYSLAADRQQLAGLRKALRPTMLASVFMDTQGFARALEDAYRELWKNWCRSNR